MMTEKSIRPIAYIEGDFPEKFGIPRQSGLVNTQAEIHFLPEYRKPEAFRGLEEYSHLWLIWDFSEAGGYKLASDCPPAKAWRKSESRCICN